MASCNYASIVDAYEGESPSPTSVANATSTTTSPGGAAARNRRKRGMTNTGALHHTRHFSDYMEDDSLMLMKLDEFLSELEDKLNALERYAGMKKDEALFQAYNTLQAIKDDCDRVKGEVKKEGQRRAAVLVEALEASYSEILQGRETLSAKVHHGIDYLTELLADLETRFDASVERKIDRVKQGIESAVDAKDKLAESIERAIKAAREKKLITYDELPWPWRVNPYILKGYRFTETPWECICSIFGWNNETCNIWTHLIGFVVILGIAFYYYPTSQHFLTHTTADKLINGVFFLAAAKALACSTIWHTFSSISHQHTMERFACVDYSGISLLIAASIITTEYTAFYVDPVSGSVYMSITAVLGIAGAILPWQPTFNRADMRVWRVVFYVSLGATGCIPMIQLCWTRGAVWTLYFYMPIVKSITAYLCGACVYAMQVPEKYYPGCFDWIGGSHNIWHACVLGGILFHWHAMHDFFHMAFEMATR